MASAEADGVADGVAGNGSHGVNLVVLGSGNAFNTDGRGSPSIWVEPPTGSPFLLDVGPTALSAMERFRLAPGKVGTVFFTHLHGDHVAGWPFLLLHDLFIARREAPLCVVGPSGTRAQLETIVLGTYPDLIRTDRLCFPVEIREIPVEKAQDLEGPDGIRFDVVPLEHHETSVGYRIHVAGRTIAVTGDTRWCPGVQELARGADIFVVECSTIERQKFAHVSLDEIRDHGRELGCRRTVLVHLTDAVASALEAAPMDGVIAAADGLVVTV